MMGRSHRRPLHYPPLPPFFYIELDEDKVKGGVVPILFSFPLFSSRTASSGGRRNIRTGKCRAFLFFFSLGCRRQVFGKLTDVPAPPPSPFFLPRNGWQKMWKKSVR